MSRKSQSFAGARQLAVSERLPLELQFPLASHEYGSSQSAAPGHSWPIDHRTSGLQAWGPEQYSSGSQGATEGRQTLFGS